VIRQVVPAAHVWLGVLIVAGIVTGCAFSRVAFVSFIDIDGISVREAGFRDVAVLDTNPDLELWPDCYQAARSAETMSLLVPLSPSLGEPDGSEKVMADEIFSVSLISSEKKKLSVNDVRIMLRTASDTQQLVFDDDDSGSLMHYNPVYRYSSTLRCGDVKDARLIIEGLDSGKWEMGVNFVEKKRSEVTYHLGFDT
jgi:hypothetical protein